MIVSHKHKFIFIKTRKTAGTSIEIALRSICGKDDIISTISPNDEEMAAKLGVRLAQNFCISVNNQEVKFGSHTSAEKIKQYLGDEIWNSYYKFCFERNPFDKVISFYYWRMKTRDYPSSTLSQFIHRGFIKDIQGFDLYSVNKIVAVDDIFKYEEMEQAFDIISHKLNLPTPLRIPNYKAKSTYRENRKHYSKVLTKEDKRIIEIMFAREIYLMGYQFDTI